MDIHQGRASFGATLSACCLVGGTCIGGGMLALPVTTGLSGFLPSIFVMVACWLAMTATGLLLMEISLWMYEGVHLSTMVKRILGRPGEVLCWALYLFVCYASLVGYAAGGGGQLAIAANDYFDMELSKEAAAALFTVVFTAVIYLGSQVVGRVNAILFAAMVGAYFILVVMGLPEVKSERLFTRHWSSAWMAIPLMLTSFSFQTLVPSLTPFLKSHVKALRIAIVGGTTLAFFIYGIWQCLMLGIVPLEGSNGLAQAFIEGAPATQFLREHVSARYVSLVAEYFAFFAIVTSYLGMALGLFDFLADGFNVKKRRFGAFLLSIAIIIPTVVLATYFERAFLEAFTISGGFGDTILNGILPVTMVWMGRYHLGLSKENAYRVPGGKPLLLVILAFFIFSFILTILLQTGQFAGFVKPFEVPAINI